MARREIRGSRAIVTGASSGIGREIARQLAAEGAGVVLVARREDHLRELADVIAAGGGRAETVVGDVTDPGIRQAAVDTARRALGGLDILVNNAGVGAMGLFEDANPGRLRRLMEVNFFALAEMTRCSLPLLKEGNRPIVVNIGSILGHRGVPYNSEYSASKFAVQGFSEAIRTEFTRLGIDVLVVSPGTTETEFFDQVVEKTGAPNWPEHRPVSASHVAHKTLRAIRRGKHEIIPYKWGVVFCWLARLSPRLTDRLMCRYL